MTKKLTPFRPFTTMVFSACIPFILPSKPALEVGLNMSCII